MINYSMTRYNTGTGPGKTAQGGRGCMSEMAQGRAGERQCGQGCRQGWVGDGTGKMVQEGTAGEPAACMHHLTHVPLPLCQSCMCSHSHLHPCPCPCPHQCPHT